MSKLILAITLGVAAMAGCYGTSGYVSDGYYGAYYSSYPSYYYGSYYPYYYGGYRYPYYSHYGHGHYAPYAHDGRGYYGGTYGHGYYGNSGTYHPGDVRPHAAGTAVGSPWASRSHHH